MGAAREAGDDGGEVEELMSRKRNILTVTADQLQLFVYGAFCGAVGGAMLLYVVLLGLGRL